MGVFEALLNEGEATPGSCGRIRFASGRLQGEFDGSFDSPHGLSGPLSIGPGRRGPGSPKRTRCDELRAEYEAARTWFDDSSPRYIGM